MRAGAGKSYNGYKGYNVKMFGKLSRLKPSNYVTFSVSEQLDARR